MKIANSIGSKKFRSKTTRVVKRRRYIFVTDKNHPRYKVRQGRVKNRYKHISR